MNIDKKITVAELNDLCCSSSSRLGCAGGTSECVFMHTVTAVILDCCSSSDQEML